jgi:hypothetical protein
MKRKTFPFPFLKILVASLSFSVSHCADELEDEKGEVLFCASFRGS